MAFSFVPVNGLLDSNTFPTNPASETEARQQFMTLFNQLKDYLNTPPTKYGIPIASGLVALQECKYWKNHLGEVTVNVAVQKDTGNFAINTLTTIATLPVGFRPQAMIRTVGFGTTGIYTALLVTPTGEIQINTPQAVPIIAGVITFLAV